MLTAGPAHAGHAFLLTRQEWPTLNIINSFGHEYRPLLYVMWGVTTSMFLIETLAAQDPAKVAHGLWPWCPKSSHVAVTNLQSLNLPSCHDRPSAPTASHRPRVERCSIHPGPHRPDVRQQVALRWGHVPTS